MLTTDGAARSTASAYEAGAVGVLSGMVSPSRAPRSLREGQKYRIRNAMANPAVTDRNRKRRKDLARVMFGSWWPWRENWTSR
jgi:hypothetical protein